MSGSQFTAQVRARIAKLALKRPSRRAPKRIAHFTLPQRFRIRLQTALCAVAASQQPQARDLLFEFANAQQLTEQNQQQQLPPRSRPQAGEARP